MATIKFYAGEGFAINELSGSGLGFYGSDGFSASIAVGEYNSRTFITDSNGVTNGGEVDNVKYLNSASGILGQVGTGIHLKCIPNYQSTLNIRFTHGTQVKIQNAELRGYDRYSINNPPSGVVLRAAEIIHPPTNQSAVGSGDTTWTTLAGSSTTLALVDSPGTSGLSPNGAQTNQIRHDWFTALSASPDSIGSKTKVGLYFSCEYL